MSELIENGYSGDMRKHLMAGVSCLALMALMLPGDVHAAGRPDAWIELGGQLEAVVGSQQPFVPTFLEAPPSFVTSTPAETQHSPRHAFGAEGKLSFEPEDTNWVYSVSVRYGRSNNRKKVHTSQYVSRQPKYIKGAPPTDTPPTRADYYNSDTKASESHLLLDFVAGKDLGIGLFGRGGSSVISGGVRFVQFSATRNAGIQLRPDLQYYDKYPDNPDKYVPHRHFHDHQFSGQSTRGFHGVGPTVSWQGSEPFAGDTNGAQFAFDWGINAAVLFGRQKVHITHTTKSQYFTNLAAMKSVYPQYYTKALPPDGQNRSRSVVVPNVGGFLGFSLKFPNAKASLGYRADFFFHALDTGIDARQTGTVGFQGPFATISIGLGG
jgi:hypothetical protein